MRLLGVFLLAFGLVCNGHRVQREHVHSNQFQIVSMPAQHRDKVDLCPACIQFANEAIENLLNIIANVGVIGTCSSLCGILANDTNSQVIGIACDLFCSYVGIKEFVKLVEAADLDAFYFCDLIKVCPILDNGDAELVNVTISPAKGPQGTQFHIDVTYSTTNGTGTGEFAIDVDTVDHVPVGDAHIMEGQQPGTYTLAVTLHTKPDPNCDPTQGFCEQWLPGDYTLHMALCYGECGSKHPHSQVYFEGTGSFAITEQ